MKALLALTAMLAAIACAAPVASTAAGSQGYPFVTDTLARGGGSTISGVPSSGFSWADAGVGAAAGIGVLLLLTGSTIIVLHRRGRLVL